MEYIGLDIGTTTISSLLIDGDSGTVLKKITVRNPAKLTAPTAWMQLQDPEKIVASCQEILKDLLTQSSDISGIGLTGQMHGVVYVDENGRACSDFVTWQDERGNQIYRDGQTYCQFIESVTGHKVATGYGSVTLFHDAVNHRVPAIAKSICPIPDYIAMRLTGRKTPLIHASNAASLGLFDLAKKEFDWESITNLDLDPSFYPETVPGECLLGTTHEGIPVAIPIGDNQASFLGAVGNGSNVLINIGTGSQLSAASSTYDRNCGLEYRPYLEGQFLLNGSSLCGGYAYQMLEDFFKETLRLFGTESPGSLMKKMDAAAEAVTRTASRPLVVDTRFRGSRSEPSLRGTVTGIGTDNFTPGNLAYGMLRGICEELYQFYRQLPRQTGEPAFLAASGNGVRNSPFERKLLAEVFGVPIRIPDNPEEAAFGAALLAIHEKEKRGWEELRSLISYL